MAQQVLGLVGTVVGGMVGGPIGASIGGALGGWVGQGIDTAGIVNHGPRLEDKSVQSNAAGIAISKGYGTFKTAGNIVQARQIEEVATKTKNGKGDQSSTVNYTYFATFIIILNDGQVNSLRKIWANKKLVGDKSDTNNGAPGSIWNYIRFYDGSDSQAIDPISLADYGNAALAYTNRAGIVVDRLPLADSYNQVPTLEFEITVTDDDVNLTRSNVIERDYTTYINSQLFYEQDSDFFALLRTNNSNKAIIERFDARTYELLSTSNEFELNYINSQNHNYQNISRAYNGFWHFNNGVTSNKISLYDYDGIHRETIDLPNTTRPDLQDLKLSLPYIKRSFQAGENNAFVARCYRLNRYTNYVTGFFNEFGDFEYTKKTLEMSEFRDEDDDVQCMSKNGTIYFITSNLANTKKYLNSSSRENILTINDEAESGFRILISDLFFDDVTNKIFVLYKKSGTSATSDMFLMRIDLRTQIKDIISLKDTVQTYQSHCLNFDADNRIFFMQCVNTNSHTSSDSYLHIKLDTLEMRRFYVQRNENLGYSAQQFRPAIYNNVAQSYIYVAGVNNTATKNGIIIYVGNRSKEGYMKLSNVIRDLLKNTSLTNSEIDVSELDNDFVKGYKISSATKISAIIEQLAQIYAFEVVDSPEKLRFTKSAKSVIATINENELGARFKTNNAFGKLIDENKTQDIELPKTLTVSYIDRNKDYEVNTQESKRIIDTTNHSVNLQLPIVLNADEARQLGDRIMYRAWVERWTYSFELSNQYYYLEPGDVVRINANNTSYVIKITEILSNQGVLKVKGHSFDNTVYVQNGKGNTGLAGNEELEVIASTSLHFLDIPIFAESDNNFGIYVTVNKSSKGKWRGAGVYEIEDVNTPEATTFIDTFSARSITGKAVTNFKEHSANVIDYFSTITVTLDDEDDELEGISYEDLVSSGKNIAVVGNEVIQFMRAEYVSKSTYKLSMLLRNRFGTEHSSNHLTNERFVMPDFTNGSIRRFDKDDRVLNVQKAYKAITNRLHSAPITYSTNTGVGQKPLAVCNVFHGWNGAGDLLVKWNKRIRGQMPLVDNTEAQDLDGDFYEIDVYKDDVLVRTIETTECFLNYSNDLQIADETVNQTIDLKIYKINKNFGRGFEYVHKIL